LATREEKQPSRGRNRGRLYKGGGTRKKGQKLVENFRWKACGIVSGQKGRRSEKREEGKKRGPLKTTSVGKLQYFACIGGIASEGRARKKEVNGPEEDMISVSWSEKEMLKQQGGEIREIGSRQNDRILARVIRGTAMEGEETSHQKNLRRKGSRQGESRTLFSRHSKAKSAQQYLMEERDRT